MRGALNTVLFLMLLFKKFSSSILAAVTYLKRTCTLVKIQTFAFVNIYIYILFPVKQAEDVTVTSINVTLCYGNPPLAYSSVC